MWLFNGVYIKLSSYWRYSPVALVTGWNPVSSLWVLFFEHPIIPTFPGVESWRCRGEIVLLPLGHSPLGVSYMFYVHHFIPKSWGKCSNLTCAYFFRWVAVEPPNSTIEEPTEADLATSEQLKQVERSTDLSGDWFTNLAIQGYRIQPKWSDWCLCCFSIANKANRFRSNKHSSMFILFSIFQFETGIQRWWMFDFVLFRIPADYKLPLWDFRRQLQSIVDCWILVLNGTYGFSFGESLGDTPWRINMEHKNGALEDDVPLQLGGF